MSEDCSPVGIPLWATIVLGILFAVITLLGIGGNAIVCYIILGNKCMRTVTNYFIVNVALSDLLVAVFCVEISYYEAVFQWPFSDDVSCKLVRFVQSVSVSVSIFTLVAISLDRFFAIIYPFRKKMESIHVIIIIILIWCVSLSLAVPLLLHNYTLLYSNFTYCGEVWDFEDKIIDDQKRFAYSISMLLLQYCIPLIILAGAYGTIGWNVWAHKTPGEVEHTRDQKIRETKNKLVKMFAFIVLVFALCYLPQHVMTLVQDFDKTNKVGCYKYARLVHTTCLCIALSNCIYNPIIYCWMNAKFRNGFKAFFNWICPCFIRRPVKDEYWSLKRIPTLQTQTTDSMAVRSDKWGSDSRKSNQGRFEHQENKPFIKHVPSAKASPAISPVSVDFDTENSNVRQSSD
ncbi:RYamide receptor-like [Anneissia japonica]|uniref:RYamide receptor-like n=1 Tax=Anneissia japonica TaxID=1529436 RepID=UPI0014259207|nr:RYamide receptor-like [Anneissia japonica]